MHFAHPSVSGSTGHEGTGTRRKMGSVEGSATGRTSILDQGPVAQRLHACYRSLHPPTPLSRDTNVGCEASGSNQLGAIADKDARSPQRR